MSAVQDGMHVTTLQERDVTALKWVDSKGADLSNFRKGGFDWKS